MRSNTLLKEQKQVLDTNNMADLKQFLLQKYRYIIGNMESLDLSVDIMVERIVTYYESIIACMPGNVYWIDNKGTMLGCNNNVLKMLKLNHLAEFKGLTFEQMGAIGGWDQDASQSFKQDTLAVATTGKAKLNIEEPAITDATGKEISFLSSRVPLFGHDNSILGVVGISIDITERKKMELALKEAKEKAEIANKAKTEFLENMRHDIRTPLSGIIGLAEILKTEKDKEKIAEFTDWLLQSSKELLNFLNDVLESINASSGEILVVKKSFNLRKQVQQILKIYRSKAFEKELTLDCIIDHDIPEYVISDCVRVYRILLELVGNALKFTKQGKVIIRLKVDKIAVNNIIIRLEVEDTGVGIPKDRYQEIFVRFKRLAPAYDGVYNGSGLGLFMVKQFVQDLYGKIFVESTVKQGSKFICLIPMQQSSNDEPQEEARFSANDILFDSALAYYLPQEVDCANKKIKILVVEDQFVAGMVVKKMLNDLDCIVDLAVDGQMAIQLFQNNIYDLVLMDIGLPDTNGYTLTKNFRNYELLNTKPRVPVLALTAHSGIEEKERCVEAQIDAVFTKPLFKEKMVNILEMFVPCYRNQLIGLAVK